MKYRSNSILAHVPQNLDGKAILKQVLFFHKALNMRVFLMDILKSDSFFGSNPKSKRNQIRHLGTLNKFTDFINKNLGTESSNNIILRVGLGKIVTTLIGESERGGYEFVVIDKSGKTESDLLSKTDVDRYVSKSYCPVLTIHKDYPVDQVKKIIIPVDVTQRTKKKLYWATFFAKKLDAKVQIVSALNINIEETKSLAFKNAEKLKKMLQDRGVQCDAKILKAKNQESQKVILDHIKKEKPELVIIRTHQEFKFSGRRIGKFVSEIVHGCPMPVFTVGGVSQNYNYDLI